ncbi:hypothetical protein CROQUDRAFT_371363 [Cronartium quercuum f. sp. fusiforme G11]|uniref:U3 small nucleolar RNA-associated protein 22 n=1 Tax=Cronartium quercuum f. sp. fusiforme G11 TaxID=708437 RepID=A0A9P6NSU3_9BASI|nr:hypothetical protein CROQUDRAFT_371363 [Cronartium quercuum f. sp. fusiforme G11]
MDHEAQRLQDSPADLKPVEVASQVHPKVSKRSTCTGSSMEDTIAALSPASGLTFPLQVSSLLETTSLPYHENEELIDFLSTLKTLLLAIPPVQPISLETSRRRLQRLGIGLALDDPKETVQWSFAFKAPQDIKVVGSWVMQNGVKLAKGKGRCNCIDLLVEMPLEVLQEKDYLSNRYFHKRAHYLACLAASLSSSLSSSPFGADFDLAYDNLRSDPSKPVLLLKPKGARPSATFKPSIRLIPSYPSTLFPVGKLSPQRANLKPSPQPSPRYNQSVLLDSTAIHFSHLSYFTELSNSHPAFKKTCRLIKVWAKQRGFYHPTGGSLSDPPLLFGFESFGWLINFIIAHVLVGGSKSGKKMTQPASIVGSDEIILFTHVIDWLAQWNIESLIKMNPIPNSGSLSDGYEFDGEGGALIDPTGKINLIANIPLGALQLLRQSAIHSSALLKSGYDVFDSLFLRSQLSFSCSFDYHFTMKLSARDLKRLCQNCECTSTTNAILAISKNISKACSNRLLGFGFLTDISDHVKPVINDATSAVKTTVSLKLGILLDPTHAFNIITHGPSPDALPTEAAAFREFWGAKCDLRRFQDGAIEECVSWEVSDPLERLKIIQQVIRWVLVEKLGFADSKQTLSDFVGAFDALIVEDPRYVQKIYDKDPKCLGFTNVMKCFNEFTSELKALNKDKSLPLAITSVQPTSEHLRYSSVFVPGPRKMKGYRYQSDASKYLPGMSCQLKFESSGKWPEDLEAIQKIKAALLAKISDGLSQNQHVIKSDIVFYHNALPIGDNVALEVLHSSGYCFVLSVCYEREEMLFEKALSDCKARNKLDGETDMILEALTSYRRKFVKLRRHHDAIAALQTRFPSFSYTVRIIKRWFASHLLSSQISTEMVELLASAVYLTTQNDQLPPATGSSGFLRFLKLMKEWEWREKPLLIPLQSSIGHSSATLTHFPVDLIRPVITNFASIRKRDPGFHHSTYFIATEDDLDGSNWLWANSRPKLIAVNQLQPQRIIADRIQVLAIASLSALESGLDQDIHEFNVRTIFKSPLQDYDFHLVIDLAAITRVHQSLDRQKYDNVHPLGLPAQIEDDPISHFVKELQRLHGDTIIFFYDALGGTTIAGIFNPLLLQPRTMKTHNHDYLTKPVSDQPIRTKVSVVMDRESTLQNIQRFGSGIIHQVLRKGVDY